MNPGARLRTKLAVRSALGLALLFGAISGCDCDDKIRQAVSDRGDRRGPVLDESDPEAEGGEGPSEVEPNDFAEQATLLTLGGERRPVRGTISTPSDRDWYALTSQNGESWLVEMAVKPSAEGFDPAVSLTIAGDEETALSYDIVGAGEAEVLPILAVGPEPLRVYLEGGEGTTGDYEITFKKRLSGGVVEAEPNDDVTVAESFSVPGEIEGFHDRPGDRDIFYVSRAQLGEGLFEFEAAPSGIESEVAIYLKRDLQEPWLSLDVPAERAARVPNLRVEEGALGLWIVRSAREGFSRERSYRLRILPHPPSDGDLEAEPNDRAEDAQALTLGDKIRGYLHESDDRDFFRLRLPVEADGVAGSAEDEREGESDPSTEGRAASEGNVASEAGTRQTLPPRQIGAVEGAIEEVVEEGEEARAEEIDLLDGLMSKEPAQFLVRLEATPLIASTALKLTLVDEDGEASRKPVVSEPGEGVVLCNLGRDRGDMVFEVGLEFFEERLVGQGFDYTVEARNMAHKDGLEVEPNDGLKRADRLEVGQERAGYIAEGADVDVYAFAVMSGDGSEPGALETRRATITVEGNDLNLGFDVLDDEGGMVGRVNQAGLGGDEQIALDLPPGLYYVRVSAQGGSSCEPYQVGVELSGSALGGAPPTGQRPTDRAQ